MKTERNILVAFVLNLSFAVFELVGGVFTGSVAILSDALHDLGDALSIGVAWLFERKSKCPPDKTHTYGYGRYSVLGGGITSAILLVGSLAVIYNAVCRLFAPVPVDYSGMMVFAVVGVAVNLMAAFATREGDSVNQRAVNLHMLEDVLGWFVVLAGAIIMRFTGQWMLDPILSIAVAIFVLVNAGKNLGEIFALFLEKTPSGVDLGLVRMQLLELEGIRDVHHIHIRSLDGNRHSATLHAVVTGDPHKAKDRIRQTLGNFGVCHSTIETETEGEHCHSECCDLSVTETLCCHAHHH